jgi:hypothetical protein
MRQKGALRCVSPLSTAIPKRNQSQLILCRLLVLPTEPPADLSDSQNDAKMVSMLYRTHISLQPPYKVPSLYAFDALARAARDHALKHKCTGEAKSGNSATFLLKLEAVLEGLFQDMMGSTVPEGKVSENIYN